MENLLRELGLDRYERQARLKPALLALLPALVTLAVWQPRVWTALSGLVSLLAGCGLTFLMAKVARYRGRVVERDLVASYGARLTEVFLRHRDPSLSAATKARYHTFLAARSFRIPTPDEERAAPRDADSHYRAAVDWLLEATRGEKAYPLVKDELIDYGFRRNLLGLKPVGILVALVVLAAHLWLAAVNLGGDETRFWTATAVAIAMAGVVAAWTFVVRMPFLEDASRSYAIRLLAACDVIAAAEMVKPQKTGVARKAAATAV
ncbi:hypothetical protein [Muricoccus vinaceus]|uniref:DUF4231 domain-containing protein n=1 Tax=Muricoccus vinaceus TaxID=424704 RepID=A0ABV6IVV1_9PROT